MKHLNTYVSILTALLIVGCNGKSIDRVHNEGARQKVDGENDSLTDSQRAFSKQDGSVWKQSTVELQKLLENKNTVNSPKVLVSLLSIEKVLLHEKTLNDKNYYQSQSFRDLLVEFNRGIYHLYQKSYQTLAESGLLKRYTTVLLDGCRIDQTECKNLAKFRGDHLTSQILLLEAQVMDKNKIDDSNIHHFYQILRASLSVQTNKNYETESMYFKHSVAYLAFLKKNNDSWAKSSEERLKTDIAMILNKMNGQYASDELSTEEKQKYCDFITLIDPLSSTNKVQIIEENRRKDLVKDYLLCQAGKNSSKDALKEALLKNIKAEKETQLKEYNEKLKDPQAKASLTVQNLGYHTVLKSLEKDPKLVQSLKLSLNHAQDSGFFVIDKLYYERVDLNQAQKLLDSVPIDSDLEFIKNVRHYTQNQTAHLINESLRIYSELFQRNYNRIGLKDNLFVEVIGQINGVLFQPWYSHIRLLGEIEKVIQSKFDKKYRSGSGADKNQDFAKTQKEILDLRSELSNIKNHLMIALSIPMDYTLLYYMSKTQGTVKFKFSFIAQEFEFDMKADQIFGDNLMPSGSGYPMRLFSFIPGGKDRKADFFPLLSMQYALKIGLFEKFPFDLLQKEDSKSGLELFMSQLLKETMTAKRPELETKLKELKDIDKDTNFKERARDLCENPIDTHFNLESLDTLRIGFGDKDSSSMQKIKRIYRSTFGDINRPNDNIYKINQIKLLVKNYLETTKSQNKNSVLKLFDDQINYSSAIQKEMAQIMLNLDRLFVNEKENCLTKFARAENYRRKRLIEAHAEYFKNIHAAMTLLNIALDKKAMSIEALETAANSEQDPDIAARMKATLAKVRTNNLWAISQDADTNLLKLKEALNSVYAVHNNSGLVGKYGYFVNEPRLMFKDGKAVDLKRVTFFDEKSVTEAVWDSNLRTRSFLKDLIVSAQDLSQLFETNFRNQSYLGQFISFPQTTVNDAERLTSWDSSKKVEILFEKNQQKFVENALRMFAGRSSDSTHVSWFTSRGDHFDLLNYRLEWLVEMSLNPPVVFGDQTNPDCRVDRLNRVKKGVSIKNFKNDTAGCGVIKISADDIIEAFLEQRELFDNTPEDRALYDVLGLYGKNSDKALEAFKYGNEDTTSAWTYFDQFINRTYLNKGGTAPYLVGMFNFIEFKTLRESVLSEKDHLLGIDVLPVALMRDNLRKEILPQLEWVFKLEKYIRKLESEHGKNKDQKLNDLVLTKSFVPRTDETMVDGAWRVLQVQSRNDGTPIYLRDAKLNQDSAIEWYRGYIRSAAVLRTQCAFLPQIGDPDQMNYKSVDCNERFTEWFNTFLSEL